MYTSDDFYAAAVAVLPSYPGIYVQFQAGDPRVVQQMRSMAAMLSMLSGQLELAQAEPFSKTRASTVLADAAMRGIIRKGTPVKVRLQVVNKGSAAVAISAGRTLLDSSGRFYRAEAPISLEPNASGTLDATQVKAFTKTHTVTNTQPLYAIEVPLSSDEDYLTSIYVSDSSGAFEYRKRLINVSNGDRVFDVDVDERQKTYVVFGIDGKVGHQPSNGDQITIEARYTYGKISPSVGSPFSLEYTSSSSENYLTFSMSEVLSNGEDPVSIDFLRELAKYPAIYDPTTVFMGGFDYSARNQFPSMKFISVWNESAEEVARGANLDNMNALFVACISANSTEQFIDEPNPSAPVAPQEIADSNLTASQISLKQALLSSDDSYRIRFFTPVRSYIRMTVSARVSTAYSESATRSQIIGILIQKYGESSPAAKKGRMRILQREAYDVLKSGVKALSDGVSDFEITIIEPAGQLSRPEIWRYLHESTLTVNVARENIITPSWGG